MKPYLSVKGHVQMAKAAHDAFMTDRSHGLWILSFSSRMSRDRHMKLARLAKEQAK